MVYVEGPVSLGCEASIIFEIDDTSEYVSAAYVESKVYVLKIGKLLEPTLDYIGVAWDEGTESSDILTLGAQDRSPATNSLQLVGTGNTANKTVRTIAMSAGVSTDYAEYSMAKSERVGIPLTFKRVGGTLTITDSAS